MIVDTKYFTFAESPSAFKFACGRQISPITIAYEAYGTLNTAGTNAILIVTGFTATAHAAGISRETGVLGWWDDMIGPGKAFDTNRFFVVCSNVLGGCSGTTGPSSIDPLTGCPYGISFPQVTIQDMVNAQHELLIGLGVTSLASVCGASMGGQQALQWLISYPDFVRTSIPIACSAKLYAMGLAVCEVSRNAILSDPGWMGGNYYGATFPAKGLAQARMAAHLTYISGDYLDSAFDRKPADNFDGSDVTRGEFCVQQYLQDEGIAFAKRFDANSYLLLSKAIEHFDLTKGVETLSDAFANVKSMVMLISFTSDWLFPVSRVHEVAIAMKERSIDVDHVTIATNAGHDAFLTDWQKISSVITGFLAGF